MRCAVSFLAVVVLSISVGLMAFYIIWITESEDNCQETGFRCLDSGKCIKPTDRCNKKVDCLDESDEKPLLCSDFTNTKEMMQSLFSCKDLRLALKKKLGLSHENGTCDGEFELGRKPEGCAFYNPFLVNNSEPPRGIACYDPTLRWSHIPWDMFDEYVRVVDISRVVNTSLLLQSEQPVSFPLLGKVYIKNNRIDSVGTQAFCHLSNSCWLVLIGNGIRNLSQDAFCPMPELQVLRLTYNKLDLNKFQFRDMPKLQNLLLDKNEIVRIEDYTFRQLRHMEMLNLSYNKIEFIHERAFRYNFNLIELQLTANRLHKVDPNLFLGQRNLRRLEIGYNPILIPAQLFEPLKNLISLYLENIDLSQIDVEAFKYTPALDVVNFKKFSYCRYVPKATRCYPYSDGLSSTSNLLIGQSRITVWLVGVLTLVGNISVLANRWGRNKSSRMSILNIFVTNLAVADFLMGIYLLVVAWKDVQTRGRYSVKAYEWGASWLCSFIGIVAMISSEVSLLILTIMSLERYLVVGGLFSQRQILNGNLAIASMLIIWTFVGILALAPVIQWQGDNAYYGSSGLCFPLHLDDRFAVGWQYTTFVFIGVNSCCLIISTISYSLLFYTVRGTQRNVPRIVKKNEVELASRFFLMVITDVLCWAPIITLKVVVLLGYDLSKEIIGWTVIYMLPINSAVNPILYTFSTPDVSDRIRPHFQCLLKTLRIHQLFSSPAPENSVVDLQTIENGCGSQGHPITATDDTEVTHSSCPQKEISLPREIPKGCDLHEYFVLCGRKKVIPNEQSNHSVCSVMSPAYSKRSSNHIHDLHQASNGGDNEHISSDYDNSYY